MKIVSCDESNYDALAALWERSVKATHDFLAETDFAHIKAALIPHYFPNVNLYAITDDGKYVGFVGLRSRTIEMLFIDSDYMGQGLGSALIDFAKRRGATLVDVNEQNHAALNFYLSKGFSVTGRDETDGSGLPYPILHMSL